MNGRTRAAGALLAAMVLLTGCSANRSTPAPAVRAATQPSAWDVATGRVAANGRLDLATALSAFALAVGPVPGAQSLPGAKGPAPSGTLAVSSVLAHWAELSAGQRAAVRAALGVTAHNAPAAYRSPPPSADPNIPCLTVDSAGAAPYRAMLAGIESDVGAHLGRQLTIADQVFIAVNTKDLEHAKMYTYACQGKNAGGNADAVTGCTIHINPSTIAGTGAELHSYLVHEVVHCFLFDRFGMAYDAMPAWYVEGAPTWAMTQLGASSFVLGGIWQKYLDTPAVPLSGRSYDGLGFFVHLAETGTDAWAAIDRIGAAMRGKGAGATGYGWAAAEPTAGFAGSWGGGFVQGRYPGPAWTSGGAPLPPYAPALPTARLADGATLKVTAPAYAAAVRRLDVDAEVVVVAAGAGTTGRLTLGGGTDAALGSGPFCTKGACSCPAGSSGAGTAFTAMASGDAFLGTTGGAHAADLLLTGSSLADFCAKPRASCLVGTWRTTAFAISNRTITEHGGAGVRMRIEASGKTTVGFDGMSPVTFTATTSGTHTAGRFTFAGTVTGEVRLPSPAVTSGRWEPVHSSGAGGLTVDLTITEPFEYHLPRTNVGQLAGAMNTGGAVGSPQLTAGTWRCDGDTLVSTAPPAAGITGTWTLARTG